MSFPKSPLAPKKLVKFAKLDGVNLNIIKTLKKTFNYPIAFSDHSN